MDERHWWFAGKLQETFHFSGYDNPSVLEDFLSDFEVADLITKFLAPGEPRKLFFYCEEIEDEENRASSAINRQIKVTSHITKDLPLLRNEGVCLYILKKDPLKEIDVTQIDKELYCGEIQHSVLASLSSLLSDAYAPILHGHEDWGSCSKENISSFLQTFDKLTVVIQDLAVQSLCQKAVLLQPSPMLKGTLLHIQSQPGSGVARMNLGNEIVSECESLLSDWIASIEGLLIDATDERLEDPIGFPHAERQKWERRQIHLCSVIEQLKWRESTAVIATLAAVKSKTIKKWRAIDTQLTEAFNGCKDKVWYLSALQPHFDAIQVASHPAVILTDVLPGIATSIKQMEGISRLFAQTGYIAVVFRKIANLLTSKCQQLLKSTSEDSDNNLWSQIFKPNSFKNLNILSTTLQEVIRLSSAYRDLVYQSKDSLLFQQGFSNAGRRVSQKSNTKTSSVGSGSSLQPVSTSSVQGCIPHIRSGLSLNNIADIVEPLIALSSRAENVLEIIKTTQKLSLLCPQLTGLPRLTGLWKTPEDDRDGLQKKMEEMAEKQISKPVAYSESTDDSVVVMICSYLTGMHTRLQTGCPSGSSQVFATHGKEKDSFQPVYEKYCHLVTELQENICRYLLTLLPQVKESKRGLDIMEKFHSISFWPSIQSTLHRCAITAFKRYSIELEQLQQNYENQKGSPPLPRGRSPIVGAIEWARNLLKRVEGPMNIFREDEMLMKTPESHHVCSLHNRLATALIQYETVLLKQLKERMEKTVAVSITAPLLRLQDEKGGRTRIVVNSDTGLLQMLDEAKAMKQLKLTLPVNFTSLLNQELRIKEFNQQLQYEVNRLLSAIQKIDPRVSPLFDGLVDTVIRFYLPGWTTLTWSTLNIDPYLHQVDTSTNILHTTVDTCHNILNTRVYPVLESIEQLSLIDTDLANSKVWTPQDFSEAMQNFIDDQKDIVIYKATQIRNALQEIVVLVEETHDQLLQTLQDHSNTMSKSKDFVKLPTLTTTTKSKRKPVIKTSHKADKLVLQDTPVKQPTSSLSTNVIQKVLQEFSNLIREAVASLVIKSLTVLHDAICQFPITIQELKEPIESRIGLIVMIKFSIPSVLLVPTVANVYDIINELILSLADLLPRLQPWGVSGDEDEEDMEKVVDKVYEMRTSLKTYFEGLNPQVSQYIDTLKTFDHLWQKDLHVSHTRFQQTCPTPQQWRDEVMELVKIENEIMSLPGTLRLGPLQLITTPLKSTLQALASNWRSLYSTYLHDRAKVALDSLVQQRETMIQVLTSEVVVGDLSFLREVLELLEQIDELQLTIDEKYLAVEEMYRQLREFQLVLPRHETEEVDSLRIQWDHLISTTKKVHDKLLIHQRLIHEQETIKQVKEFVVKTIQFRNEFDTEGPLVPGLTPNEAVSRVGYFLEQCEELQSRQDLLDAVQKLLNISLTPYPELEHTQEELSYLRALYSNYQDYISFDESFQQVLWSEVDLESAIMKVDKFWQSFLSLPQEQQDWEASQKLSHGINNYRLILPLFIRLHSKEIRSRHWIQIMNVSGCNFPLEARFFKMEHLLEADLLRFSVEINGIVENALKEQELETQFLAIEEEWSEQVLQFHMHSSTNCPLLSLSQSLSLLEQLDSTQTQLTTMLMSQHINPLRNETSQWAGKLSAIAEVLQLWLSVQELWLSLQPVFSNTLTSKDFPEESVTFSNITDIWIDIMNQAASIKNCIQCCLASEDPIQPILQKLNIDLEQCKMSLSSYLSTKRQTFPRLYFIPDDALLTLMSNSLSSTLIKPYLGSLFGGVANLCTNPDSPLNITTAISIEEEELLLAQTVLMTANVEDWLISLLSSIRSTIQQCLLQAMDNDLPSLEELVLYQLTQVASVSLHHQWTKDCEQALASCRYDRRAIPGVRNKFNNSVVNKLSTLLMRQSWRHSDKAVTYLHHTRLECLIMLSLWLRDLTDDLCQRKIRDANDFEWIRFPRLSLHVSGEGDQELKLHCLDVELPYHNEFLGCQKLPVFSPKTDAYIISLTQSSRDNLGSCVVLPSGGNKTEIIKGFAFLIGQFTPTLYCSSLTETAAIVRLLTGIAQDGSWGCLCDAHLIQREGLSLLSAILNTLSNALRSRQMTTILNNSLQIHLQPNMAVFLTHSTNWSLPTILTPHFRSFSLPSHDSHLTLRTHCLALGFKGSKSLIHRLETVFSLINDQLSTSSQYPRISVPIMCLVLVVAAKRSRNSTTTPSHTIPSLNTISKLDVPKTSPVRSPAKQTGYTPNQQSLQPLTAAVIREHTLVAETLAVLLGAQFNNEELPVFQAILKDTFQDCPDIDLRIGSPDSNLQLSNFLQSTSCFKSQLSLLEEHARSNGLTPTKAWLEKTEQLYLLSKTNHAIILSGSEASGKTSALKTVVSALNSKDGDTDMKTVRLQKIYPCLFTDQSEVFGSVDKNGSWRDGIFTGLLRKTIKATQTTIWICFDGPLLNYWYEYLGEITTSNKCMSLGDGEHLRINTDTVKLVFETGYLVNASPAALTYCSVVYFDSYILGWRTLASSWLKTRRTNEGSCLQKLFESTVDQISQFVLYKLEYRESENEVSLFKTCLAYLGSLLNAYMETAEVFSELHVERLFLFSLIWSFGGVLLKEKEQKKFSQLLRQLTNSLPDDDTEYSVFDYYVDESGEWDVWQSKIPEQRCQGVDLMGRVFVETPSTIRVEMLLELAQASRRHVLLVGPHASGKTATLNHFLSARALHFSKTESVKRVILNGYTQSSDLHHFMQIHLHHRQGYTYGPNDNRCLHLLLEDLHLPQKTTSVPISTFEYLRQIVDSQRIYNLTKTNQCITIEDLLLFGTISSYQGTSMIDPRLKRHFTVIPVSPLIEDDLEAIVPLALQNFTRLTENIPQQLVGSLSKASRILYQKIASTFKKSESHGRQHYMFSLNQLETALQGLGFWPEASNIDQFVVLWKSEVRRAFGSSLCHEEDKQWLEETIITTAQDCFEGVDFNSLPETLFSGISPHIENSSTDSNTGTTLSAMPEVSLHAVTKWEKIQEAVQHYITRYCEEEAITSPWTLELCDDNLRFVVTTHRAIKHARGNCVLVGSLGQPIYNLAQLSLYIAGYTIFYLKDAQDNDMKLRDMLRSLFRLAGLEGKQVAIILQEQHLQNSQVLGILNSFLSSSEFSTLFTVDEMDSLLQALVPCIKRDFPSEQIDPEQYFSARICQNLRVVMCVTPHCDILNDKAHLYQGLLQQAHIIWMEEWNTLTINRQTTWFFASIVAPEHNTLLTETITAIHYYMLAESGYLKQAGIKNSANIQNNRTSTEHFKMTQSFRYLMEKMSQVLDPKSVCLSLPYVGPLTLRHFLECFCRLYREKNTSIEKERVSLRQALVTLQSITDSVQEMQCTLDNLKQKLHETSLCSNDLQKQVISKSCELERVKALLGQGGAVLSAMRMVSEQKRLLSENEEDDYELLAVFFDRLSRKSSRIDVLMERAQEQLKLAMKEEEETRQAMIKTKEQAHYWQNRIDRNTIDQIKTLHNPPALIGTIMELMLNLLQKYGAPLSGDTSSLNVPTYRKTTSMSSSVNSKMEREHWSQLQIAIGDSQRFLDLLNNLKWEEGLSNDAVALIESKLATSDTSSTPSLKRQSSTSDSSTSNSTGLITVAMAKYASESAAIMCAFAVAIVNYQYSFQPHLNALKKVEKLNKDLEALQKEIPVDLSFPPTTVSSDFPGDEEEAEVGEDDLVQLENDLTGLQNQFDKCVMEKHSLQKTCEELVTKLKLARNLLESLKLRQEEWNERLTELPSTETLLANCVISAAFLTYCGPLQAQAMQTVFNSLLTLCSSNGLSSNNTTFQSLSKFLVSPQDYHHLYLEGLPMDQQTVLRACVISNTHSSQWPLVIDPLEMVCRWLRGRKEMLKEEIVIVKYQDQSLKSSLIQCMTESKTLVITDVDVLYLANHDDMLKSVIASKKQLIKSHSTIKTMVDGKEVDCSSKFKLILVTKTQPDHLPRLVSSQCSVVLFHPDCSGLESRLLDEFLEIQNPKTFSERTEIRKEICSLILTSKSVENELLLSLDEGKELEIEAKTVNKLLTLNKSLEFAQESLQQLRQSLTEMNTFHLSTITTLANRSSIIINTACLMSHIQPLYNTSFDYALLVFKEYIRQAGSRIQGEDSLSKLTKFGHSHFERGFMELDKQIFSIFLAIEIESSQGRASVEEREFLLCSSPGSKFIVRGLLNQRPYEEVPVINFGKKPFDWMTETQWQKLLVVASHFEWIHPILASFGRDGKEMFWRTISEGASPETILIAEGIGQKLTLMQQFLIQCALRPERVTQFALVFTARVLEHKPLSPSHFDLQGVLKGLPYQLTSLLIYENDPHLPAIKLQHLAQKCHVSLTVQNLSGIETDHEIDVILKTVQDIKSKEQWVLLTHINSSNTSHLMMSLNILLNKEKSSDRPKGRLWLSIDISSVKEPPLILKHCFRIALDASMSPLNSLVHTLHLCSGQKDIINRSSRTEWLPLLHSIAMFHIILVLKQITCHWSFHNNYKWGITHLWDAISYVSREFTNCDVPGNNGGVQPVSWSGIRYMISEVYYGSLVTSESDFIVLNAITEYWLHPGGPKRESGRYQIPAVFFTPNTRLNNLLQAIENASPPLVPSALLYGLHYTPDLQLGWKDVIFPLLAQLNQIKQDSIVLSLSTEPIRKSPMSGRILRDIHAVSAMSVLSQFGKKSSSQPVSTSSSHILDKLPTFIQLPCNMLDCQLEIVHPEMLSIALTDTVMATEIQSILLRTVTKLLDTFPPGWKKDILLERLRKLNTESPYGKFLMQETQTLNRCMLDIVNDLQNLQTSLKISSIDDVLLISSHLHETALALLLLKVPSNWSNIVGMESSPPPEKWDLKEWCTDLVMRFAFMDKIITWGLERTPTFWLGAFFNPKSLLSIFHQYSVTTCMGPESVTFVAELTSRDKDHIRDPPSDGLFLYGVYLWGTHFEKTTNLELHDTPPRSVQPSSLPVIHLTLQSSPPLHTTIESKPPYIHYVPCIQRRGGHIEPLFYLKIYSNEVQSTKWTLRNLCCTLRPF